MEKILEGVVAFLAGFAIGTLILGATSITVSEDPPPQESSGTVSALSAPVQAYVATEKAPEVKAEPIVVAVQEVPKDPIEYLGEFRVTAYCTCPTCCGIWSDRHPSRIGTDYVQKTASGTIPTEGRTVAVDTSVIPFGTTLVIDGHEYVAEDTGSAINGNDIDIYFADHEDARAFGVQNKTVYVKEK